MPLLCRRLGREVVPTDEQGACACIAVLVAAVVSSNSRWHGCVDAGSSWCMHMWPEVWPSAYVAAAAGAAGTGAS